MKIMIFNTLYHPHKIGGAEVSVQLLAEELARKNNEVCVVTIHAESERKSHIINGVKVVYLPLMNIYWPFSDKKKSAFKKILWHLKDYINRDMYKLALEEISDFKPDVIHTNNVSGFSVLVWKAAKVNKIKLIHTSRDYYLFHPNSTLYNKNGIMSPKSISVYFWSYYKRKKSKLVDEYVAISDFVRNQHVSNGFFKKENSSVIYNSVKKIETKNTVSDITRVGFIGRLTVEKGFDDFCKLAALNNNQKYKFIAAGNYLIDSQLKLEELAKNSGVEVFGYMDLEDFLNDVDVVVLPIKWNEPFGRTIVECALAGKIVLTTSVGSMPELSSIFENVLVSDSIENSFKLINIEKNKFFISESVSEVFDAKTIADKYVEVYLKKQ